MKQFSIFLAVFLFIGSTATIAQSEFKTTNFKKALRPALVMPLEFNSETAEKTILAKLKETGYKPEKNGGFLNKKNKEEGFYKFSGVVLPELQNQKLDLYFKVDPTDNDKNYRSSITLLVSKGYENFVSPETDSATAEASEKFLNGFVANTEVFQLNQQLEQQKGIIAKSEKKWNDLRGKQEDAKKKIVQLESDIKNWKDEETRQQQDVDTQRATLKDLENKRSSLNN